MSWSTLLKGVGRHVSTKDRLHLTKLTTALLNIFGHAHHAHACPLDRPLLTNTGSRLHPEHGLLGSRQVPISLLIGTVHCHNGLWHRACGFAGRAFTWLGLDIRLRDCGVFQLDHTCRDCGVEEAPERGLTSSSKTPSSAVQEAFWACAAGRTASGTRSLHVRLPNPTISCIRIEELALLELTSLALCCCDAPQPGDLLCRRTSVSETRFAPSRVVRITPLRRAWVLQEIVPLALVQCLCAETLGCSSCNTA